MKTLSTTLTHTLKNTLRAAVGVLTAGALGLSLAACGDDTGATVDDDGRYVLNYQGTPGTVSLPELADDLGFFENTALNRVSDTSSGPVAIQNVATGETDFGSAFNGAIAKLRASGSDITAVVDSYGADEETYNGYLVRKDSDIRTGKDLIGRTVGMNTLGAHGEFITREWLRQQGLTPEEIGKVNLVVVEPVNNEEALRTGQIDVGSMSSVFLQHAKESGEYRELFTDKDLFDQFSYGSYVFRDQFIRDSPEAVEDFARGIARAIAWLQTTDRTEVVDRYRTIMEGRDRNEDPALAEYYRSSSIPKRGGVIQPEEFSIWTDWLVRSGDLGDGELDPEDLYTNDFNPYATGELS
ncbi:ABC transporter substrate-binding protein [uncultured Corynebacterium sp.]|uniref:ABC transporter substrate-binding protein n=1 Tax=uncultured Corynebacterium sp. TaxID=159447 RepID=UPI0025EBEB6C|nr:ABC transporter substrate-binding protein [uncultured Corynebacterium sp.]